MNCGNFSGRIWSAVEEAQRGNRVVHRFVMRSRRGRESVHFYVELWDRVDFVKRAFRGARVLVTGSFREESWENRAGERRTRLLLVAQTVEFVDEPEKIRLPGESERAGESAR